MTDIHNAAAPADELAPRGHNNPPPTLRDADSLLIYFGSEESGGQYADLAKNVTAVLTDIRDTAPGVIETDQQNGVIAAHMETLRSTLKTVGHHHESEKAPYLTAGRTCDQFFFAMRDRLTKARDILQARGNDFTARKVAEERRLREVEAKRLRDEQAAAQKREADAAAAKAAADAAAERARKPENIAAHEGRADAAGVQQAVAQVDVMIAADKATAATSAALAPSASIARTRHDSGHLSTAKQVPYVQIEDKTKLDLALLLPFIKDEELLRALKAWAKVGSHKIKMDGAIIEMRDAADYR